MSGILESVGDLMSRHSDRQTKAILHAMAEMERRLVMKFAELQTSVTGFVAGVNTHLGNVDTFLQSVDDKLKQLGEDPDLPPAAADLVAALNAEAVTLSASNDKITAEAAKLATAVSTVQPPAP